MQAIQLIDPADPGTAGDSAERNASTALVATPAHAFDLAVQRGASIDQIERFMAAKERWEAAEAKKAFNVAFAAFKAEAVKIIRTKKITDGPLKGKSHAELSGVIDASTPALSRYGLSTAWRLTQDTKDWMEVTCTLSHVAGHSETVSMGGAPDTGPGRNAIQARGSTKTYLERYTLTAILGLAASDADDDGAGGKGGSDLSELLHTLVQKGRATKTDAEALAFWNAEKSKLDKDKRAYAEFKDEILAHRRELQEAQS